MSLNDDSSNLDKLISDSDYYFDDVEEISVVESSESEDETNENVEDDELTNIWVPAEGKTLSSFQLDVADAGFVLTDEINEKSSPLDIYTLFVTSEIIHDIVKYTNLYIEQCIIKSIVENVEVGVNSFLATWSATDEREVLAFILYLCGWN